jgi:hypothetical protein
MEARINFSLMSDPSNPYKPNDKVFITVKGAEVEATVRLVWKDEVQVRPPSGGLIWRTVRTVRATATPVAETPTEPVVESGPIAQAPAASHESETGAVPVRSEEPPPSNGPSVETESAAADTGAAASAEPVQPKVDPIEQVACGVPEVEADRKRSKKSKRHR